MQEPKRRPGDKNPVPDWRKPQHISDQSLMASGQGAYGQDGRSIVGGLFFLWDKYKERRLKKARQK